MVRGRKPKPLGLRIIEGSGRPRGEDKTPCRASTSDVPAIVADDRYALEMWEEMSPEVERLGLLTLVDRNVFVQYCVEWSEYRTACEGVRAEGRTCMGGNGTPTTNPWVRIRKQSLDAFLKTASELGLTPGARERLKMWQGQPGADEAQDDDYAVI